MYGQIAFCPYTINIINVFYNSKLIDDPYQNCRPQRPISCIIVVIAAKQMFESSVERNIPVIVIIGR